MGSAPVEAQADGQYAGIVVRVGDGTVIYAYVPLDEPTNGIELLRQSGVSLVTVGFGGLGEGVCRIEETGCDVSTCRKRVCQTADPESPYWRYFQADDSGEWVASPLGGSGTKVEPGDVDGWSWTPDEALLPEVDFSAIPTLAKANGDLDEPHFARYDADGNLLSGSDDNEIPWPEYFAVTAVLIGVAGFAMFLKLRPKVTA
jgi:hypothetical protein